MEPQETGEIVIKRGTLRLDGKHYAPGATLTVSAALAVRLIKAGAAEPVAAKAAASEARKKA